MTLLTYDDVRVLLGGVSRRSITRWVRAGIFPPPVHIGPRRLARFRRSDLRAYFARLGARRAEQRVAEGLIRP